jgi:protease-4
MSDAYSMQGPPPPPFRGGPPAPPTPPVVVNNIPPKQPWLGKFATRFLLAVSILANVGLAFVIVGYFQGALKSSEVYHSGDYTAKDKIAIIEVSGMITQSSAKAPIRELKSAEEDKDVKAVVLRVDSPGGDVAGTDQLYRAILRFKEKSKKPVIVQMDNLAASGAFWISMPADFILAGENCITGSIGVIMNTFILTGLMREWGIEPVTFKTGALKDAGSMFREMTEQDREEINKILNAWFQQFLGVILKHRGERIGGEEKLMPIADGRVFMAGEAKSLGLIDDIGYLERAIEVAKERALIVGKVRVVTYQRQPTLLSLLESRRDFEGLFTREKLLELQTPQILVMPPCFVGGGGGENG